MAALMVRTLPRGSLLQGTTKTCPWSVGAGAAASTRYAAGLAGGAGVGLLLLLLRQGRSATVAAPAPRPAAPARLRKCRRDEIDESAVPGSPACLPRVAAASALSSSVMGRPLPS